MSGGILVAVLSGRMVGLVAATPLPDHQDLTPPRLEADFTVGVSLRVLFMGELGGGQLRGGPIRMRSVYGIAGSGWTV